MTLRVDSQSEPLGVHDAFKDVISWDEDTAKRWVDILNLRASSQDQIKLRARLIQLAKLRPADTVVEIGSGTGALLCDLANSVGPGGRVIGIEPQPFLAKAACERLADAGYETISEVRNESAHELSLESESAAVCLAQTVLIHLSEKIMLQSLSEMIRVVQRAGRVLSVDQDGDTWVIDHPNRDLTRRIVRFNSDQRYADGWTGRRLRRLFCQTGLGNVEVHAWSHVDTEIDSYLFGTATRLASAAAAIGVISESEHLDWVQQLHEIAAAGHFFSSMNYYACVGVRV